MLESELTIEIQGFINILLIAIYIGQLVIVTHFKENKLVFLPYLSYRLYEKISDKEKIKKIIIENSLVNILMIAIINFILLYRLGEITVTEFVVLQILVYVILAANHLITIARILREGQS